MDDPFITPASPVPDTPPVPEADFVNRNFKGQQKNEVVLCFCRKHWIALFPHMVIFTMIFIVPFLLLAFTPGETLERIFSPSAYRVLAAVILAVMTYYFHRFFLRCFTYYLQILIITNFRVIQLDQTLFFKHNRDSIDLPEIQDIVIQRRGLFQTVLNYGELTITLSSAHATKVLSRIPNPEYYFRKINKTKREYITSRRVQKAVIEEKGKGPL